MALKKISSPNPRKSKSLKDLQILNEVIYNKNNVWMRRLFLEFGGCNYILLVIYNVNNIKMGLFFSVCWFYVFDIIIWVSHKYWIYSLITFSTRVSLNCIKKWKKARLPMVFFKERFLLDFFSSKSKNRFLNLLFFYSKPTFCPIIENIFKISVSYEIKTKLFRLLILQRR